MFILQVIFLIIIGHFTAAFLVYFNHRFIFHGKLGTKGPLKIFRRYHTLHHAFPEGEKLYDHIYVPIWARILFIFIYLSIAMISIWFSIGMATFSVYYGYNHLAIHEKAQHRHSYYHHSLHHDVTTVNFSGMYPFIDRLFSTYKESRPIL
jgi:sterol desaturase/sphingolipid hydroxylase (fatty acid hydroxylase superfamily)